MVGIQGINGIPEPAPGRSSNLRERKRAEGKIDAAKDGVTISTEAQEAAEVSRMAQAARNIPDIRADRVAAAKANLEKGNHKNIEVLRQVARNLLKYL